MRRWIGSRLLNRRTMPTRLECVAHSCVVAGTVSGNVLPTPEGVVAGTVPQKVAVIDIRLAIVENRDGQKALTTYKPSLDPRRRTFRKSKPDSPRCRSNIGTGKTPSRTRQNESSPVTSIPPPHPLGVTRGMPTRRSWKPAQGHGRPGRQDDGCP